MYWALDGLRNADEATTDIGKYGNTNFTRCFVWI